MKNILLVIFILSCLGCDSNRTNSFTDSQKCFLYIEGKLTKSYILCETKVFKDGDWFAYNKYKLVDAPEGFYFHRSVGPLAKNESLCTTNINRATEDMPTKKYDKFVVIDAQNKIRCEIFLPVWRGDME